MDYERFFDELIAEYARHNIKLRYKLSKNNLKFETEGLSKPISLYVMDGHWEVDGNIANLEVKEGASGWVSVDYFEPYGVDKNYKNENHLKFFTNTPDVLYCLAYELGLEVGRLCDSLHARMILSTDKNGWLRKYVKRFGNVL